MSERCVVLYGPMGSGKSTVGEKLADTLGYDFLDLDAKIEDKAGKTITEIFEEAGESGFRQAERDAVAALAGSRNLVIATGGGAPIDPANRKVFASLGHTVYLKASPRELYQRIKNDTSRPLLAKSENPREEIARILADREQIYYEADIVIDTEELSVEEVAEQLIDELARRTVDG